MDRTLIDRKKLKQAIHNARAGANWEIEASPKTGKSPEPGYAERWANIRAVKPREGKWSEAIDWASVLYSLTAHLRGKVHGSRKYVPAWGKEGGGPAVLMERTLEDQEKLLGDIWRLFAKDPEQSLEAEMKRVTAAAGM